MQISGETARYALSHLHLHCLQKPLIAFGSERVNNKIPVKSMTMSYEKVDQRNVIVANGS